MEDFLKIDESCGNIFLIDSNICVSKWQPIINNNFYNLSSDALNLENTVESFENLFNLFATNSAKIFRAFSNIESLSADWNSAYNTVIDFLPYWNIPITIIYPKILDHTDYFSNTTNFNNIIKNWLNSNFPTDKFKNTNINILVNITKTLSQDARVIKNYTESCYIYSLQTAECRCEPHWVGCNFYFSDGNFATEPYGCSLCSGCGMVSTQNAGAVSCGTISPPSNLNINFSKQLTDTFLSKTIKLTFAQNLGEWVIV